MSICHLCPDVRIISGPQLTHIQQLSVRASTSFTFEFILKWHF